MKLSRGVLQSTCRRANSDARLQGCCSHLLAPVQRAWKDICCFMPDDRQIAAVTGACGNLFLGMWLAATAAGISGKKELCAAWQCGAQQCVLVRRQRLLEALSAANAWGGMLLRTDSCNAALQPVR